jgi:hypothetical protein
MSVNPELRKLDIDIPSQPQSLVQLSLLMADEDINMQAAASLIETDMALAAAVMKAVNSSLYGLKGRVQSVHQAITYLGMREVAAITFEMGLRAAFPPAPELEPLWKRAGQRGTLMGKLAAKLSLDAWGAHSAGLFEECGKAVLFRHATDHYRAMLRATDNDVDLVGLEGGGRPVRDGGPVAALSAPDGHRRGGTELDPDEQVRAADPHLVFLVVAEPEDGLTPLTPPGHVDRLHLLVGIGVGDHAGLLGREDGQRSDRPQLLLKPSETRRDRVQGDSVLTRMVVR